MAYKPISILVVEDDELERLSLRSQLSSRFTVHACETKEEATALIESQHFDLIFLDLNLQGKFEGFEILALAHKIPYRVIISGAEDEALIGRAYELGCRDYLGKPIRKEAVDMVIQKFLSDQNGQMFRDFFEKVFITKDAELIQSIHAINNLQGSQLPIFLSGPSGTGKTELAKFIHRYFFGSEENFIHLNCSEIPENLLESELFGHEKGAFTGANEKKLGKLELAKGGTLFLDEVATMPLTLQKKLLRVLEEKDFYPLGSTKKVRADFRLIAATWENLDELIKNQQFRLDLYYRLQGFRIHLPPLSERREDVAHLIKFFLKMAPRRVVLTVQAMEQLKNYSWPGNVRELKRVMEMVTTHKSGIVDAHDLPFEMKAITSSAGNNAQMISAELWEVSQYKGLSEAISLLEEEVVQKVFQKNQGKVRLSLRELKISNSSFYKILARIRQKEQHVQN